MEQESGILSNYQNRNDSNLASNNAREVNAVRTGADGRTQMKNSEIQSSQHPSFLGSDDSSVSLTWFMVFDRKYATLYDVNFVKCGVIPVYFANSILGRSDFNWFII